MHTVAAQFGIPVVGFGTGYAHSSIHAPNEHILEAVSREALQIMTGLFWDLGEAGTPGR